MSDNTEFPTSDRIQELREQGIVSYSSRSGACLLIAALSVALLAGPSVSGQFLLLLKLDPMTVGWESSLQTLRHVVLIWLVVPLVMSMAVLVVWGLFQTRFLINPGLMSLDFSRLLTGKFLAPERIFRRAGITLAGLLTAAGLSFILLKTAGIQIFRTLHTAGGPSIAPVLGELREFLPVVILIGCFSALVLLLAEKLRFSLAHRMSRKEVLEEQKG